MLQRLRLSLLSFLLLALAAPTLATAPPRVQEEITVQLINVDVHATDRDGKSVRGLTRQDFKLFDGDRPVEISNFAWIPADGHAAGAATATSDEAIGGAPARRIAIFFDELQISNRSRIPLLRALATQLVDRLRHDDQVSIVRFDGAELELVLPWTSDRHKIDHALEALGSFSVRRLAASQDLRDYWNQLQRDISGAVAKKHEGGCPDAGVIIRSYADLVRRNVVSSANALLDYAQHLSRDPGPRLLVHVSDGIPLVAGAEVYQYAIDMCSGEALSQGVPNAFSVALAGEGRGSRFDPYKARLDSNDYQMAPLWRNVAARLNALGITVYAVQASDPASQFLPQGEAGILPASVRSLAEQNPVDTLALLARETGGLLVRADRGAESEVGRMAGDLGGYYSLAFSPSSAATENARRIRVEVDRPGVHLRYRRVYRLESRDERVVGQLAEVFAADHIDNPLGIELSFPAPPAPGHVRLRVAVPLAHLTMIDVPPGERSGSFVVYVTLRRGNHVFVPRRRQVPLTMTAGGPPDYTYDVDLPVATGEVGVAVADTYSGEVSFARAMIPGTLTQR